jgi:hypothetical protein
LSELISTFTLLAMSVTHTLSLPSRVGGLVALGTVQAFAQV